MLVLSACSSIQTDHLLTWVRADDGAYSIGVREVPELDDAIHMTGELGAVTYGGRIASRADGGWVYTGGVKLTVHAVVMDLDEDNMGTGESAAVPLDEDGLLLYTFYANLAAARAEVEARGVDTGPMFPMDAAWNPAVNPLIEITPADNAAYATGSNTFLLLPDGGDRDVPLLANQGALIHEFGHAIFHLLTTGDPFSAPLATDPAEESYYWQASLHEGFADTQATLLLDDPSFIDASIEMPERRVDDDHAVLTEDMLPANRLEPLLDDPYPLGTVYASFAWDLRVASDPDTAYAIVLDAIARWAPSRASDVEGTAYLQALLQSATDAGLGEVACASAEARFALLATTCPTGPME